MTEAHIIKVKKRKICPSCGMTVEVGGEMFRSLKMPGEFVCSTCAIRERREIKKKTERQKEL